MDTGIAFPDSIGVALVLIVLLEKLKPEVVVFTAPNIGGLYVVVAAFVVLSMGLDAVFLKTSVVILNFGNAEATCAGMFFACSSAFTNGVLADEIGTGLGVDITKSIFCGKIFLVCAIGDSGSANGCSCFIFGVDGCKSEFKCIVELFNVGLLTAT